SSLNPSTVGASVTFTATVQVGGVTATSATGTVQFRDNGAALGGAVAVTNGVAQLTTGALAQATHPISAVYNGSASHAASTSGTVNQQVNAAPPTPVATTTALSSSLNPSTV